MFFILSKILVYILKPFIWILILLIWFVLTKKAKRKKILLIVILSALVFFSNTVLTSEIIRHWEIDGKKPENISNYDCGILLGGMSSYNGNLDRLALGGHGDRIWQTIDLYKRGKIRKILISGDDGDLIEKGLNESKQLKIVLVRWGIPEQDILIESKSKNTRENALFSSEFLKKSHPHLQYNLLITSATHMRRSLACFEKIGITLDAYSTAHYTGKKRGYTFEQFIIPDASNFEIWDLVIKEIIGYCVYDLVGYI